MMKKRSKLVFTLTWILTHLLFSTVFARAFDFEKYGEMGKLYQQIAAPLKERMEKGDLDAMARLGELYYEFSSDHAKGCPEAFNQALQVLTQAAEQGCLLAQYYLGLLYVNEPQLKKKNLGYRLVFFAAEEGLAYAQVAVGRYFYDGQDCVKKDTVAARKWFEKAAAQDVPLGISLLAACYLTGIGGSQDPQHAVSLLRKVETIDDDHLGTTFYFLGMAYECGLGVSKNYQKALEYYEKAQAEGFEAAAERTQLLEQYKVWERILHKTLLIITIGVTLVGLLLWVFGRNFSRKHILPLFSFRGRCRRRYYWKVVGLYGLGGILALWALILGHLFIWGTVSYTNFSSLLPLLFNSRSALFFFLLQLPFTWIFWAISIKRLHDCGYSGRWFCIIASLLILQNIIFQCILQNVLWVSNGVMAGVLVFSNILAFCLCFFFVLLGILPSESKDNQYGPARPNTPSARSLTHLFHPSIKGRIAQHEYAAALAAFFACAIISKLIGNALNPISNNVRFLLSTLIIGLGFGFNILFLCCFIRRLHDFNLRGWWIWLPVGIFVSGIMLAAVSPKNIQCLLVNYIGLGAILAALVGLFIPVLIPGNKGPNRFGLDPQEPLDNTSLTKGPSGNRANDIVNQALVRYCANAKQIDQARKDHLLQQRTTQCAPERKNDE